MGWSLHMGLGLKARPGKGSYPRVALTCPHLDTWPHLPSSCSQVGLWAVEVVVFFRVLTQHLGQHSQLEQPVKTTSENSIAGSHYAQ